MWLCKSIPLLCALVPKGWIDPSPPPSIDLVKITHYVQQLPIVAPTVTVTVALPQTPTADHPGITATSSQAPPRPTLNAYNYGSSSNPFNASPSSSLAWQSSFGQWLIEEQFSPLHLIIFLSMALFVVCVPCWIGSLTYPSMNRVRLRWAHWVRAWHEKRKEMRRIERILDQHPLPTLAIGQCFFPDTFGYGPPELHLPFPMNLVALGIFLVYLPWTILKSLPKCFGFLFVGTIVRFPGRVQEFVEALFNLDELSWKTFLACVAVVPKLLIGLRIIVCSFFTFLRNVAWLCLRTTILRREYNVLKSHPGLAFTEAMWDAYKWAFETSYEEKALFYLQHTALLADHGKLQANMKGLQDNEYEKLVRELAEKAQAYRRSLIEALSDVNYWRTLVCNIMNYRHNIMNSKSPDGPDSQHPYQPSQVKFISEADPVTKLHYTINQGTVSHKKIESEFLYQTKDFYSDKKKEALRLPSFVAKKMVDFHWVPKSFDPFKENTWVIKAAFPGIVLAPYSNTENPIDVTKKRPAPILKPNARFGKQIEDVAAAGRLLQWRKPEPKQRVRFGNLQVQQFHAKEPIYPTTPKPQLYCSDPCPDGSPMDVSPIRW